MREEKQFTRLTLEQSDRTITWEMPYEDVDGEDMMNAINTIMIGMTFHPKTVLRSMAGFLMEWASDEYEIYEKDERDDLQVEDGE